MLKRIVVLLFAFQVVGIADASEVQIVEAASDFSKAERYEAFPGGAATHRKRLNGDAFSFPSNNMNFERQLRFSVGNRLFTREWVSASPSSQNNGGIGPLFNARSCQACHFKDGRGHLPSSSNENAISLILKLDNAGSADKVYGAQLQDFSVQGVKPEGQVVVKYNYKNVELADGSIVELRRPLFSIESLGYGDLESGTKLLPRVAPQMIGLGLLEAIAEKDILSSVDANDSDDDGVIGRARFVNFNGKKKLGRFGWKSGAVSVEHQTQLALLNDMGFSSPGFSIDHGDCTRNQEECLDFVSKYGRNGSEEMSQELLDEMTFYARNLAVPERREYERKDVLAGKKLFYEAGCTSCHKPKFITPVDKINLEQSRQLIWPYTDLLMHDMGNDLADPSSNDGEFAKFWRTPPLWGIGLTAVVNREYGFLHDGRARNVLEAILWHGGEASQSKQAIIRMTSDQRRKLLLFVNSL